MTKSRLKLASVVALAVLAACTPPLARRKTLDAVTLTLEKQPNGKNKAIAKPDHLKVYGYDPNAPDSEVTWVFRHKATAITFKDPRLTVNCDQACKRCTLTLPAGLAFHTQYKYTIRGKDNEDVDLDPNDPDIEVYP